MTERGGETMEEVRVVCGRMMWSLYTTLFLLSFLDIITTYVLLQYGGTELNGLAVTLWGVFGFFPSAFFKMILNILLGIFMVIIEKVARTQEDSTVSRFVIGGVLLFLVAYYLIVVVNNLFWLGVASRSV